MTERRFCASCGATLAAGAAFCPSCGAAVGTSAARPAPVQQYSPQPVRYAAVPSSPIKVAVYLVLFFVGLLFGLYMGGLI